MINVLTIGVSFALLKYDRKLVEDAVRAQFNKKIAEMNITALNTAYDYAADNFKGQFKHKIEKIDIKRAADFLNWKPSSCHGQGSWRMQNTNLLSYNSSG